LFLPFSPIIRQIVTPAIRRRFARSAKQVLVLFAPLRFSRELLLIVRGVFG
jgi:hypothetical protein